MGGLIQPSPLADEKDSSLRPILIAIVLVAVLIGVLALVSVGSKKAPAARDPYATDVQLSNLKMSQAENFVGASVTYIDGTVTNAGNQTVTHAVVHVVFKNSMNEIAQAEDVALHVLSTSGPYPDAVDLSASPLTPGQSKPFRLIFEHISADWNQAYPDLQVTSVSLK
jgi:hypothetical protein